MRPASAGRTKPAGTPATLQNGAGRLVRLLAPEEQGGDSGCADPPDRDFAQSGVLAGACHGLLGLPPGDDVRALPTPPAEQGIASIQDGHAPSFPAGRAYQARWGPPGAAGAAPKGMGRAILAAIVA